VFLKQRQSFFDGVLLLVVLPAVCHSPLRPLGRLAALWHKPVQATSR
jgi:hypothetical protein